MAVAKIVRAMSKICARRLMAGTVNPETSPRLRAAYSSWMLADGAPSSWLASQIIQRAASTVAASVENVWVQARSWIVRARNATSSVTTQPAALEPGGPVEERDQLRNGFGDGGHGRVLLALTGGEARRAACDG